MGGEQKTWEEHKGFVQVTPQKSGPNVKLGFSETVEKA